MLVIIGCTDHYFYFTVWNTGYQKIHCLFRGQILSRDDRLCGLVVRVPGYKSIGSGSIPGATRFSEK
jgi:hypothetical protein